MEIIYKQKGKCGYYEASRSQRKNELERGLGEKWTQGFSDMGCYECNGEDKDCKAYYDPYAEYKRGLSSGS